MIRGSCVDKSECSVSNDRLDDWLRQGDLVLRRQHARRDLHRASLSNRRLFLRSKFVPAVVARVLAVICKHLLLPATNRAGTTVAPARVLHRLAGQAGAYFAVAVLDEAEEQSENHESGVVVVRMREWRDWGDHGRDALWTGKLMVSV